MADIETKDLAGDEAKRLQAELHAAEIEKAKLEAELAARRELAQTQITAPQAPPQITEQQWKEMEEQTGMTKNAIMANAEIMKAALNSALGPIQKELEDAKRRAEEAESRISRMDARGSTSKIDQKFYKENPALTDFQEEVESFMSDYPAELQNDPKKRRELLEKAKTYVKGKLGDKMNTRGSGGSSRLESGSGESETEERLDTSDLTNKENIRFVEDLHASLKSRFADEAVKKRYDAFSLKDGSGVMVPSDSEWEKAARDPMGKNS